MRLLRVTVIIRTRQKCSIKAIFVAFAVALRKQGCHLKTSNLIFTPSIFDALQFIVLRFGLNRGTKHRHTCRMPSILTKSKGKSATINRGSDYYRYPRRILMEKENTYEYKFDTVKPVPNVRGQHLSA